MAKPLVSVCVPIFNHERYIESCIQSILNQDYENIELIVIDDGSSDASVDQITKLFDLCKKRFKRFQFVTRENRGLCRTLNEALSWCCGEYFAILASDDQWLTNKISLQVDYLSQNQGSIGVFGGINIIDDENVILRTKVLSRLVKYSFDQVFLSEAFLPAPTALLRIHNVKAVGGFNQNFRVEDWYMWLRLTEGGDCSLDCLPQVVANYRRHSTNLSKNYEFMLNEQYKVIDLYGTNPLYKKSEAALIFATYTGLVPHDKFKAISLVPGFFSLWREPKFWFALAKLLVPQTILLKRYN